MTVRKMLRLSLVLLVAGLILESTALLAGATPRKMNGTWQSLVAVPPNDVLGNTQTEYLPEFDTYSTSGTVVTTSAAPILPLDFDQGAFLVGSQTGHGNEAIEGTFDMWRCRSRCCLRAGVDRPGCGRQGRIAAACETGS